MHNQPTWQQESWCTFKAKLTARSDINASMSGGAAAGGALTGRLDLLALECVVGLLLGGCSVLQLPLRHQRRHGNRQRFRRGRGLLLLRTAAKAQQVSDTNVGQSDMRTWFSRPRMQFSVYKGATVATRWTCWFQEWLQHQTFAPPDSEKLGGRCGASVGSLIIRILMPYREEPISELINK